MGTIKRLSLSEQVVNLIVQYIQENGLQPGDQLPTENEFAERFGVSRTSIREAMKALSINGILKSTPGRGTFLQPKAATLTLEEDGLLQMQARSTITEVMEVRTPLEIQAIKLAVQRCSDEDVAALDEICRHYEEAVRSGGDHSEWGRKFHAKIAQTCGNPMLINMVQSLAYMTDLYRQNMAEQNMNVDYFTENHRVIVEAFRERDVEKAAAEMASHMELTFRSLAGMVDSDNASRFIPWESHASRKKSSGKRTS